MAKKNIKKKENQEEPITKCDQSNQRPTSADRQGHSDAIQGGNKSSKPKGKKKRCSFP
jgi:hypothetical protein